MPKGLNIRLKKTPPLNDENLTYLFVSVHVFRQVNDVIRTIRVAEGGQAQLNAVQIIAGRHRLCVEGVCNGENFHY